MNKVHRKFVSWFLSILAITLAVPAWAGSITNNFNAVAVDYVANGIIGETFWDGVYLGSGDVPNGVGGNGIASTLQANNGISGFLAIQTTGSDWAGADDDGFYAWKLVAGDFDVSVESAPVWTDQGNNFGGLLVRAYDTNNSGAAVSFTTTNLAENFLEFWRDQEFSGSQIRQSTNGNDFQYVINDAGSADTNTSRFYRINRTGDTFTFYWKTNQGDAWYLASNATNGAKTGFIATNATILRPDWHGQPVQVGIAQAIFATPALPAIDYFTDFELTGTNVNIPVSLPAAPSNFVGTATNTGGSISFSWNRGNPGDNSLVVARLGVNINQNPIDGIIYNADASFGDPATQIGGNEYVVYNGSGTNVTVTNLGGNNLTYNLAVYEYSTNGPIYNTASPATNSVSGPGIVTGIIAIMNSTNIPVTGAALGTCLATFSSGSGTLNESALTSWSSSDPTIANFNNNVLMGIAAGSVTVTASFGGFTAFTNVTVHAPVFTDNFATAHDYIASGLEGTPYDGLYLNFGDVPGTQDGPSGVKGATSHFDASITTNGYLNVESAGTSWATSGANGPYLFKYVTGDFEASVHVHNMNTINNNDAGLMARLYNNSGTTTQGGAGGAGNTAETHINLAKLQNGTPVVRQTIDAGNTIVVNGLTATDGWLLMQRVNSTNFYLYESSNPTNSGAAWSFITNLVLAEAAGGAPMQVGLEQEMRTASDGFAQYDTLMIDGPGIASPTGVQPPGAASGFNVVLNGDLTMTITYTVPLVGGNPAESELIMRDGGPVTAQPFYGFLSSGAGTYPYGSGTDLGNGNFLVFRSSNPGASTNVSITIGNLTPGDVYYAAAYTFVGSSTTKVFNDVLPGSGAGANLQDGILLSVTVPPPPSIPLGGIGQIQVIGHYSGGGTKNVSAFATIIIGNTNIIQTASGVLTGMTNGSSQVTVIYKGFTNTVAAVVRNPIFTDNFSVPVDYLTNGVAGTPYDGLYNPSSATNDVPESVYVPLAGSGATVADADITTNGTLTVVDSGDGWENGASGGFFLYKYVPGDFQVATHINYFDVDNYNQPGLLARAYTTGTNGTDPGSPFVLGPSVDEGGNPEINGESWVSLTRFDEFGIGTYARLNLDSFVDQSTQPDQGDGSFWLLIARSGGINFSFYKRTTNNVPWQALPLGTTYTIPEFANQPMQVGIMAGPWPNPSAALRTVVYDFYMLDYITAPTPEVTADGSGNVIVTWPADPHLTLQSTTTLSPSNWQPVLATPTLGVNGYSVTLPALKQQYFRLKQ